MKKDLENNFMPDSGNREIRLTGIKGSPGICIGKAYLVDREGVNVIEKYYIREEDLSQEVVRFKTAVQDAKDELAAIIEVIPEDLRQNVNILEAHMALYKDRMLYGKTIETIENEMVNAEWALKKVVSQVKSLFQNISDPYLQGRATDIVHVSDRIFRHLMGHGEVDIAGIDKRVILVAHDLSPADTSQIQLNRVMGFVTDRGGKTSHTGIIARTLGIPSVLGLDNATDHIKNDDIIIVDGKNGVVIIHPTDGTIIEYQQQKERYEAYKAAITRASRRQRARTEDGVRLDIMGNIELPEEVVTVLDHGGDGIGLYRTEFLYLAKKTFPQEDELFEQYKEVAEILDTKPIIIRTLDINGDKTVSYTSDLDETNPALGLRAIRFCLRRPDVFKTQLRAILRASHYGNVRIMIPMISGYEEVIEAKKYLKEAADELTREGIPFDQDIKIGIMIEVPSAVIMADILADEVDFFSIGTNDLVQYLLAIDRGNRKVAHLYHPLHPAVMRMIKHVIDVGRKKKVRVFMCGEMAGDPFNMPILLGLGMKEFSMTPQAIPAVKEMVRQFNVKESKKFIHQILNLSSVEDIVALTQDTYGDILTDIKQFNESE